MTDSIAQPPTRAPAYGATSRAPNPASLADVLERVLDKGIIIAGDIRVDLLQIELLTIRIRLLVASVDKLADENQRLRDRLKELEPSKDDSD
jgi:hypothetical protein